jgi:hypothetical protein
MNLLFQRVKLLFDVEVNICHVAAAFDYLSPQSLAALAVNPLVEQSHQYSLSALRIYHTFNAIVSTALQFT